MQRLRVVLVGPKYEGNIGSVARLVRNFEAHELVMVDPPLLGPEAKWMAVHAWQTLESARTASTFEDAIAGCDYVVGTSARIPPSEKRHLRNPIPLRELPATLEGKSGTVALCFGREDFGLFNEELEACDLLVTVPTSPEYPSMNLSQAVAVVLYELYEARRAEPVKRLTPMSGPMRDMFFRTMDRLIDTLRLPEHKDRNTRVVVRRIFGRAAPSAWEYFVFMGVLSGALRQLGVEVENGRLPEDFDLREEDTQAFLAMLDDATGPAPPRPGEVVPKTPK